MVIESQSRISSDWLCETPAVLQWKSNDRTKQQLSNMLYNIADEYG